jgi:hypothetical protein
VKKSNTTILKVLGFPVALIIGVLYVASLLLRNLWDLFRITATFALGWPAVVFSPEWIGVPDGVPDSFFVVFINAVLMWSCVAASFITGDCPSWAVQNFFLANHLFMVLLLLWGKWSEVYDSKFLKQEDK